MVLAPSEDPLGKIRPLLIAAREQVQHFQSTLNALEPKRGELRWLGVRRYRPALRLIFRDAQDVLNHAAALIGYFDGYDARGAFQQEMAQELSAPDSDQLAVLLPYLRDVLVTLERVLVGLLAREPLVLAPGGPRKPGPERTLEVCTLHLDHIEKKVCAMVLNLASSKALKQRAQQCLDEN